jgi:putative FmdB family regulatory protein
MPIYEFYCSDCHTIYSFLSHSVNTEKRPACPKCGRPELERKLSLFAISKGRKEEDSEGMPDVDESKLERAFESMAGDLDNLDEEDPRAAAGLMRRLFDATGMQMGRGMEEAIRRMEAGEDPEAVEAEMGDVLENEDPLLAKGKPNLKAIRQRFLPPKVDPTLYEL